MKCPNCGSTLQTDEKAMEVKFCPYCGYNFEMKVDRAKYELEMLKETNAHIERMKQKESKEAKGALIFCAIGILIIFGICILGAKGYF